MVHIHFLCFLVLFLVSLINVVAPPVFSAGGTFFSPPDKTILLSNNASVLKISFLNSGVIMTTQIIDSIKNISTKFAHHNVCRKKISALENLSCVRELENMPFFTLIKKCASHSFLDEKEADFLDHMIDKHFLNTHFLDWSHKTPWLKREMKKIIKCSKKKVARIHHHEQLTLNFTPLSGRSRRAV